MADKRKITSNPGTVAGMNQPGHGQKSDKSDVRGRIKGARVALAGTGVVLDRPPKPKVDTKPKVVVERPKPVK